MPELMPDWLIYYAAIIPVTALAGMARGVAGFGGPFIMVPVFNLFHPPATTIVVVLLINFVANLKLLPEGWREKTNRATIPLAVGTIPLLPLGSYFLLSVDPNVARTTINIVILACALLLLSGWRYRKPIHWAGYATLGAASGLTFSATSIAVQMGLFLQAGQDTAKQGRANFIVWSFYASLTTISIAFFGADHDIPNLWWLVTLAPIYFVGLTFGIRLYRRMGDATLRRLIILFVLIITSISLIAEFV